MRSRFLSGFAVVFCKPMRASAEKNGGKAAEKRHADFKFSTEMSIALYNSVKPRGGTSVKAGTFAAGSRSSVNRIAAARSAIAAKS